MDFFSDYPTLDAGQQARFRAVVTRLLSGQVLTPGSPLKPEPDWRFAERYHELIDGYLRIGGWRFDIDLGVRVARAVHEGGEQRVRFNKLESLILCTLRLVYHERMREASADERCEMRVGELRERLVQSGKPISQLSRGVMVNAIRKLAKHSLVSIERGFEGEDDESVIANALIERVLPTDKIQEIADRVRTYQAEVSTPEQADEPDEPDRTEEPAT